LRRGAGALRECFSAARPRRLPAARAPRGRDAARRRTAAGPGAPGAL